MTVESVTFMWRAVSRLLRSTRGEGLRAQLVRGGLGSIGLKVANLVLVLALSIVLARALEPSGYGLYATAMAVVTLLGVPAQLGLQNLLVREVAAYQLHERWPLLKGVLRFGFFVVAGMTLVIIAGTGIVAWLFGDRFDEEQIRTMLWGLAVLPFFALGGLRGAALRGLRRVTQGQLPEFLLVPGLMLLFIGGYLLLSGPITPSTAMALRAASSLIAFGVGSWLLAQALPAANRIVSARYETKRWLKSTMPLSFSAGVQVLHSQTGIIVLGAVRTSEEVGLFRVAVQGAALVAFTLSAVALVIGPHIARLYSANDRGRLQRLMTSSSRLMLLSSLPIAGVLLMFGGEALQVLFGEPYRSAYPALAILCVGQIFHAATGAPGLFLNMTGHEGDTAIAVAVTAVLNVVLNLLLIPQYGIAGAAIATAVSLSGLKILLYRRMVSRTGIDSLAIRLG